MDATRAGDDAAHGGIEATALGIRYVGRTTPALRDVTFTVRPGELLGVAGATGAGKSTLALACAAFIPRVVRAKVDGTLHVAGIDAPASGAADGLGKVGIVFSTPANQLSASKPTVREELAFGLENLAVPRDEMDRRIDAVLERLSIAHLADREPFALSGGEQQRVAIASIVAMDPAVLIVDEPTAQLDPLGTEAIADLLREVVRDGRAVLAAEHAPGILAAAGRVLVLAHGERIALDAPGVALGPDTAHPAGIRTPTLVALAWALGLPPEQAFDEAAIARRHRRRGPGRDGDGGQGAPPRRHGGPRAQLAARGRADADDRGPGRRPPLSARTSWRSTASTCASSPASGSRSSAATARARRRSRSTSTACCDRRRVVSSSADGTSRASPCIAWPRPSASCSSIRTTSCSSDRCCARCRSARATSVDPRTRPARLTEAALVATGLADDRATNPYDLDLSRRKLVALASVLAVDPPIVVLDEPTTGQDAAGIARIGAIVDTLAAGGRTVIAITHDMELAARHFDRIIVMRDGRVAADGPPREVFATGGQALLEATGLRLPPAARIAARLGWTGVATEADLAARLVSAER